MEGGWPDTPLGQRKGVAWGYPFPEHVLVPLKPSWLESRRRYHGTHGMGKKRSRGWKQTAGLPSPKGWDGPPEVSQKNITKLIQELGRKMGNAPPRLSVATIGKFMRWGAWYIMRCTGVHRGKSPSSNRHGVPTYIYIYIMAVNGEGGVRSIRAFGIDGPLGGAPSAISPCVPRWGARRRVRRKSPRKKRKSGGGNGPAWDGQGCAPIPTPSPPPWDAGGAVGRAESEDWVTSGWKNDGDQRGSQGWHSGRPRVPQAGPGVWSRHWRMALRKHCEEEDLGGGPETPDEPSAGNKETKRVSNPFPREPIVPSPAFGRSDGSLVFHPRCGKPRQPQSLASTVQEKKEVMHSNDMHNAIPNY